jgi:hypothetical protein
MFLRAVTRILFNSEDIHKITVEEFYEKIEKLENIIIDIEICSDVKNYMGLI